MENTQNFEGLSLTGKRWAWPENPPFAGRVNAEIPEWLNHLLWRRGVVGEAAVQAFLEPSLKALIDPAGIQDMPQAVDRLLHAIREGEAIVVYGDYDVDGVCATAILVEFLRGVGAQVNYYIPDRRMEGYGLNAAAVADIATRAQVLVTVDCGITAVDEVALAQGSGMDVVVVDHHQVGPTLPPARACLNPHRPDCPYPFKDLCAAGVAFMLAVELRRALRAQGAFAQRPEPDVRVLLDMVAVATVADMVPLHGTNRVLVSAGLRQLRLGARPGLAALCRVAKVEPPRVTATDLGFRLGPRINARGRMSQAGQAVELMLCRSPGEADVLAKALDEANTLRRQVERQTVEAAAAQVEALGLADAAALVLYDPTWHPGVLGLVASRMVARWHRPVVAIGEGGKGSGRSVEGFNLHAALQEAASHLEKFGGHPAAAGVTIRAENVAAFRDSLAMTAAAALGKPPFAPTLRPDLEVHADALHLGLCEEVQRLAPFGRGNAEPLFAARRLRVHDKRLVGDSHLKLRLGDGRNDAIAFGMGDQLEALPEEVDAVFYLEANTFRGQTTLQMRIEDLRPALTP